MDRFKVLVAIATLLPSCAFATSPVIFPPGEPLKSSSAVVLAVPREISCRITSNLSESGIVKAEAKVTWQVLISWKGAFRIGDTFKSNESIGAFDTNPCFYSFNNPLLLYLIGNEPFETVWSYELENSVERFKELDAHHSRHGT